MPAEHVEIRIEIVQDEYDERQRTFLPPCDRPVVLQDLAECALVQEPGDRVVARDVADAPPLRQNAAQ
jgi:hypothetical protein